MVLCRVLQRPPTLCVRVCYQVAGLLPTSDVRIVWTRGGAGGDCVTWAGVCIFHVLMRECAIPPPLPPVGVMCIFTAKQGGGGHPVHVKRKKGKGGEDMDWSSTPPLFPSSSYYLSYYHYYYLLFLHPHPLYYSPFRLPLPL